MKDFLIKEEILRAARNTPNILLDGHRLQIYPDISQATLERRRNMKEITSALHSARIRYRWGFPFKLIVPHNGSTYVATKVTEGPEILIKLGLLNPESAPRPPSTPRLSPLWQTPASRRDQCRNRNEIGEIHFIPLSIHIQIFHTFYILPTKI